MSLTTVNQTKNVYIPENTEKVIIDLTYDPVDSSEWKAGSLTFTIDFDNNGNDDYTGGNNPAVANGNRHEELDVDPGMTGGLWAFDIVGQGFRFQRNLILSNYVELRIEYSMSVQLILGGFENESFYVEFDSDNSMIAPLRFGTATPDYAGGELEMNVHYYDLEAVKLKEEYTPPPDRNDGIPAYLFPLIGLILIFMAFTWRRMQERRKGSR
jgi:hypothetical protein